MNNSLQRFSHATLTIAAALDLNQLLAQIVEQGTRLLDASQAALWLRAGEALTCTARFPDGGAVDNAPPLIEHARIDGGRLLAPLKINGDVSGILVFGKAEFNEETIVLAEQFASHAALSLQNARTIQKLDSFAGTVTHELKSPLAYTVFSLDDVIERFTELPLRDIHETLISVLAANNEIAQLVDSLLEWATLGSASHKALEPVDCRAAAEAALVRLSPLVRAHEPSVEFAELLAGDSRAVALGRRAWVEVAWTNLLGNALKYGADAEGAIQLELGATREGHHLRCWVRDRGRGIDPADQQRLFVPLARLVDDERGRGLGLSITQRLVEEMGGAVGVESEAGRGSTFYFTLPVSTEQTNTEQTNTE